jgi:membrane protein
MASYTNLSTPLWLDLVLATGAIALVFALDRSIRPYAERKGWKQAFPSQEGVGEAEHWDHRRSHTGRDGNTSNARRKGGLGNEDGAIGTRPSQEPHGLQEVRAEEIGRGREAKNPTEIPARGWKDILWRTYSQIGEDRLLAVGAGAVFYLLLSMFPAITAFVSSYGLFADTETIGRSLTTLSRIIPQGALEIVQEQVTRLTATSNTALGFGFFFGLVLALWSANAGMKAIIDALNVVYDEREKRSFIKLNLVSLAFTLGALAVLGLALASVVILPLFMSWLGFETMTGRLMAILRWPILMIVLLVALALLYRFAPSREIAKWRWLSVGSVFAALAWLGGSLLFSWYLSNFADYDATYGSLGAAIGLMMWLWLSVIVILVGAELNAEIEHQTARDTTTGSEKPLGSRGAVMADTLGESWRWREGPKV